MKKGQGKKHQENSSLAYKVLNCIDASWNICSVGNHLMARREELS